MKIVLDGRALSHPQPGGFKSYSTNLIDALVNQFPENEYTIFIDRPLGESVNKTIVLPDRKNISIEIIDKNYFLREQILLPRRIKQIHADISHFLMGTGPVISPSPLVVTIHDAIEFIEKVPPFLPLGVKTKRFIMGFYSRLAQKYLSQNASMIITVSSHSKKDLIKYLGIPENRIRSIPIAQSRLFQPRNIDEIENFRRQHNLPHKFILALASASPRKNVFGLLRIYAKLPRQIRLGFPLVILLTHSAFKKEVIRQIEKLGIEESIKFLSGVDDESIVLLYNSSSLFIFPSLYEGFGLPVIEAMACGIPVMTSSLTSIPEIAGDAAELADPRDEEAFARTLEELLLSKERQTDLSRKGLDRSQMFSWCETAQSTQAVYHEIKEKIIH